MAALALAAAACSSSSSTAAPGGGGGNGATNAPAATGQTGNNGGSSGLSGAAAKLSGINSYKFKMTLAGGSYGSLFSALGGAGGTGNGTFTVTGTIVTTPAKAADIEAAGLHIIEIGGYDYMDLGTGSFVKTPASGTSMADSFSPATIFPSLIGSSGASGYQIVGSETKNGVDTDHYQASSTTLAEYGSMLGVTAGATWSGDIWIAKSGGYPVSSAILATATDKSVAFEMSFDLSNINDSANSITAPTNIMGGWSFPAAAVRGDTEELSGDVVLARVSGSQRYRQMV